MIVFQIKLQFSITYYWWRRWSFTHSKLYILRFSKSFLSKLFSFLLACQGNCGSQDNTFTSLNNDTWHHGSIHLQRCEYDTFCSFLPTWTPTRPWKPHVWHLFLCIPQTLLFHWGNQGALDGAFGWYDGKGLPVRGANRAGFTQGHPLCAC